MNTDAVEAIRAGYSFDTPAIRLGALVHEGSPRPDVPVGIALSMLNRHGLVAGATGTGKTKTLQVMAEQISRAGVPVFAADIKGDLSGIAIPGEPSEKLAARAAALGQDWQPEGAPTEFYALGGQGTGVPLRATVTSFGPLLLSKVLGLNDTQESTLALVFQYADAHDLDLIDLADLGDVLRFLTSDAGKPELAAIGGVSKATAGVILREISALAGQGGDVFFGLPEFDTSDLLRTTPEGLGVISMLELPNLQDRPALFSTFLMWLLADLHHDLPEAGDLDKPKLVFFFDEAHLLFDGASKAFNDAIERTVRLIRSKGVGVFFVTQSPTDVPDDVLAQLGSRVQHALRAHTPNDAKALRATVNTYPRSQYDLEQVLQQLGIGEAIVTVLNPNGAPTPVAWTRILAPTSLMAPMDPQWLRDGVARSGMMARYGRSVDPESASEKLAARAASAASVEDADARVAGGGRQPPQPTRSRTPLPDDEPQGGVGGFLDDLSRNRLAQQVARQAARTATTAIIGSITRSIFGTARRRR